jgi:hypothetical protein
VIPADFHRAGEGNDESFIAQRIFPRRRHLRAMSPGSKRQDPGSWLCRVDRQLQLLKAYRPEVVDNNTKRVATRYRRTVQ